MLKKMPDLLTTVKYGIFIMIGFFLGRITMAIQYAAMKKARDKKKKRDRK